MFQHTTILLRPDALIRMEGDNMSALSTTGHNDGITLHCL
ncbi:LuxR family transcriptional regulator, partial [Salmonella enterica subsp. enterica serovar Braenderup]|nr:LuxR family transcriptional regulator [Salmonella enterica subsp. enterica serovar Braenderup]